jgi:hypothetical protein
MKQHTNHLPAMLLAGFIMASATTLTAQQAEPAPAASPNTPAAPSDAPAPAPAPSGAEYKNGLWLNLYQPKKELKAGIPDWNPLGAMVVDTQPLSPGAIGGDEEYKNYENSALYFMWEGYVRIQKPGAHTLIMEITLKDGTHSFAKLAAGIYLGDSPLASLDVTQIDNNNQTLLLSADAALQPGVHLIRIPFFPVLRGFGVSYSHFQITLKIMEPGSRRARILAPGDLLHKD